MFKDLQIHASFNERTGYGIHASRFFPALEKLVRENGKNSKGTVHITLIDSVSIQNINERHPYPSILYNVWESSEQPQWFIDRLQYFDQLWVASEAQRSWSIAQGIPEEFVKVVPEGVDPDIYKPIDPSICDDPYAKVFNFLHVGQWQPRKSTIEIVQSFLKAFPDNPDVRLYLSTDTLFPSDNFKSTEERLEAYGLQDPRIIPVHFEEREAYIRRLQNAHCFVTCARSEGWNLPLIEAMACGIPSITADFGGSTEYAMDALVVRVPELRKPHGIYGDWDVPGQWGEPDYDHLVELMQDVYRNYADHKNKAIKTSDFIRTKFSWDAAAKKAYDILEELSLSMPSSVVDNPVDNSISPETSVLLYARKHGFEITSMQKRSAIFTVDCHPTSQEKMDTLVETITQIKGLGFPVLVTSHCALPAPIVELADYYIYDKRDILSGDDLPTYWRVTPEGKHETTHPSIPCHALAALHNVRNAVDFCLHKYDWIYQMSSDTEIDLPLWLEKVHASTKDFICFKWENQPETVSGQITAARTHLMDVVTPRLHTWEEFAKHYGDDRFCSEKGYYRMVRDNIGLHNVEFLDMDIGNRFNQVDTDAWKDDTFQCHFVEGPFLNISGLSNREYDVSYSTPVEGNLFGLKQKVGVWSRPDRKYFQKWTVKADLDGVTKFEHTLDLAGQNVLISMGSKALGDTIAWIPYVEEFRKFHKCNVFLSGWWMEVFDYPEINFIKPGSCVENIYASYDIGCFDDQLDKNVKNWRLTTLQQVASDILGLEYKPIRAKLKHTKPQRGNGSPAKPYVCFSEFSTMKNKLWNRDGAWQKIIDHLNSLGYECISVSAEMTQLKNVTKHNGQPIQDTINDVSGAEFYIGLNAGPSWIAYALDIPCIMITGVSEEWNDFPNPYRVDIKNCQPGCFNDPSLPIDRGWEWCPRKKDYKCTREITEELVIEQISKVRGLSCQSQSEKEKAESTPSVHPTPSMPKELRWKKRKLKDVSLTQ